MSGISQADFWPPELPNANNVYQLMRLRVRGLQKSDNEARSQYPSGWRSPRLSVYECPTYREVISIVWRGGTSVDSAQVQLNTPPLIIKGRVLLSYLSGQLRLKCVTG